MPRCLDVRAGILFAVLLTVVLSCGENTPTEPGLPSSLNAPAFSENFETSAQRESRELLIDGRPTDIEWNGTGDPTFVLARGDAGTYYILMRTLWTYDARTLAPRGIYFLLQWPDRNESRLEQPLVTTIDTGDEDGITTIDCDTDDIILRPSSWSKAAVYEDQVYVEIFADSLGGFPADQWRWGAGTTDPAVPVNPTEYTGATLDETRGSTDHPVGGAADDYYNTGSGWVLDAGRRAAVPNNRPGTNVPLLKTDKATRDVRLNRGKPASYVLWRKVASQLTVCDTLNPIRVDEAAIRDKTWNPGDYVPSVSVQLPDSSQSDVVARGSWTDGKWSLEFRRELVTRPPDILGTPQPPRPDDLQLQEGRRYLVRFTIYNASKDQFSQTDLLPLYLQPRN